MPRVLVLAGDGIGPEVTAEAVAVLAMVAPDVTTESALIGGCAIDAEGAPLSDATVARAQGVRLVLLGAVGGPKWDKLPPAQSPRARPAAHPQGARALRESASRGGSAGTGRREPAEALVRRWRGPDRRARADRRHLLRRAARARRPGRRATRAEHGGLRRARGRAHRARRVPHRARTQEARHEHPQGQRARGLRVLERDRRGDRARVPRREARAPAGRLRGDDPVARRAEVRRAALPEHVRRHPLGRGRDDHGLARHAAVGEPR